jgi:cell division initiation protein
MKITPQDIHQQEFRTSMRGYDKDEVDAFLQMVADEMETLIRDNTRLKDNVKELEAKMGEYIKMERKLEETLLTAQKVTDQLKENADREAKLIIDEAKMEADNILNNTRGELSRIREDITRLETTRDELISQMKALIEQNWKFIKRLEENISKKKTEEDSETSFV